MIHFILKNRFVFSQSCIDLKYKNRLENDNGSLSKDFYNKFRLHFAAWSYHWNAFYKCCIWWVLNLDCSYTPLNCSCNWKGIIVLPRHERFSNETCRCKYRNTIHIEITFPNSFGTINPIYANSRRTIYWIFAMQNGLSSYK